MIYFSLYAHSWSQLDFAPLLERLVINPFEEPTYDTPPVH
jgi:hypothetical protein